MTRYTWLIIGLLVWGNIVSAYSQERVLIFTKTEGFRHQSIPKGVETVTKLVKAKGIIPVHSEDARYFCADSLSKFSAVIFLNTTGNILDEQQKVAFQEFIRSGKGYMGIHAASDTEYEWPWYGELVGGYFTQHPPVQEAKIDVVDRTHLATKHLQEVWWHKDEWYDFRDVQPGLHIVMTLDEQSYKGGTMGKFHPIAWFREFDGGRTFYTGLGHTEESYDEVQFQKHIVGGIKYVLGH
ncbi:MAG TPA: ThuA domain-containing protein [Sphingobacterium sp.]|jgi:type 1 glutamine amidotransferase|nr:ThuA domain-containing protein [Sphingobacterium sp.]